MDEKTRFDRYEDWAQGRVLIDGTKDHHAIDSIRRFKMFETNEHAKQLRQKTREHERD